MRARTVLLALPIALVFVGSALAYRVVHVGQLDNGKTIILHPSDRLVVSLPGNASTGYVWRVRALDRSVVAFVSRTYVQKSPPPKSGVSGVYVLRFRAKTPGTTTLKLGYVQGTGTRAAKTYTLHLIVRSPAPRV